MAQGALDVALASPGAQAVAGKAISNFQGIRVHARRHGHAGIEAARQLVYHAAASDRGDATSHSCALRRPSASRPTRP